MPQSAPEKICDLPTPPNLALLYRLNGDENPLRRICRQLAQHEPQKSIKKKTVNDVREGVLVGDVLGILRALHHAVPELDITTGADRHPPHRIEDRGLQREQVGFADLDQATSRVLNWRRPVPTSRACTSNDVT